MRRHGWGQRAVDTGRAVTLACLVLLVGGGLLRAWWQEVCAEAHENVRRPYVCEGHGRGNYPYWSDDGVKWPEPPNANELEDM